MMQRRNRHIFRALRVALGFSSAERWATVLGYSSKTIYRWEEGLSLPPLHAIEHIREVLRRPEYAERLQLQPETLAVLNEMGFV